MRGKRQMPVRSLWPDLTRFDSGACWPWPGAIDRDGYGKFRRRLAHTVSYEAAMGAVPEGQELDHRCHTEDRGCPGGSTCQHRRCVNPRHLEPVSHAENVRRGRQNQARRSGVCIRGHAMTESNILRVPSRPTERRCRECNRERCRRAYRNRRALRQSLAGGVIS